MQKNDHGAIGRAGLGVADIQDAGIDLLQRSERRVRPGLDRWADLPASSCRFALARADRGELRGSKRDGAAAEALRKPRRVGDDGFADMVVLLRGSRSDLRMLDAAP